MSLHLAFFKHTMAFLEIAFNNGGVQCFCIFFKQTMAFLGIAFDKGGAQYFCIFFFLTYDGVLGNCV